MTYLKAAIEPARRGDVGVLYGLAQHELGTEFVPGRALEVLDSSEVFVARVDDVASGYVALDEAADEGAGAVVVRQLFVTAAAQGAAVGNQLLDWAEGLAISRGLRSVRVESDPDDDRAEQFYVRRGYRRTADGMLTRDLPGA